MIAAQRYSAQGTDRKGNPKYRRLCHCAILARHTGAAAADHRYFTIPTQVNTPPIRG